MLTSKMYELRSSDCLIGCVPATSRRKAIEQFQAWDRRQHDGPWIFRAMNSGCWTVREIPWGDASFDSRIDRQEMLLGHVQAAERART